MSYYSTLISLFLICAFLGCELSNLTKNETVIDCEVCGGYYTVDTDITYNEGSRILTLQLIIIL